MNIGQYVTLKGGETAQIVGVEDGVYHARGLGDHYFTPECANKVMAVDDLPPKQFLDNVTPVLTAMDSLRIQTMVPERVETSEGNAGSVDTTPSAP